METKEQKLAAWLREDRGRRVSEGMRAKAERGILPGCATLGYMNAVVNGERVIVLNPDTAPMVRRLFELARREGMSLRKLAGEAERMGLRSRNGKRFGPSAMKAILENPFYEGWTAYDGDFQRGLHEPLAAKVHTTHSRAAKSSNGIRSEQTRNKIGCI